MAEAPSQVPSFKLVLVGDGGTGKVSHCNPLQRVIAIAFATSGITLDLLVLRKQHFSDS
jgi:energy-converting hydrogenase Eha subunit C